MKFCPNQDCPHLIRNGRLAEFLDSVDTCSDCGQPLQSGEAPPAETTTYVDLATIYQAADSITAHLLRDILEIEGIPVYLRGESLQGAMGELPATVQQIEVQVPPEFATRARELALQFEANELANPPSD